MDFLCELMIFYDMLYFLMGVYKICGILWDVHGICGSLWDVPGICGGILCFFEMFLSLCLSDFVVFYGMFIGFVGILSDLVVGLNRGI